MTQEQLKDTQKKAFHWDKRRQGSWGQIEGSVRVQLDAGAQMARYLFLFAYFGTPAYIQSESSTFS